MRQEDKEIDGPDLERAEDRRRDNELVHEDEEELYDLDALPASELLHGRTPDILAAMRTIIAGEQIIINDLGVSKRHQTALESLKTAVDGKDQKLSRFVYAADRRALLEQALAVLQPELTSLDHLGPQFEELIKQVSEVRDQLDTLEDAQTELVEGRFFDAPVVESDTADKPTVDDDDTSLDGPPRDIPKRPTSLTGPERKPEPKPATSLTGPERKPEPKPATSLGDPKEIAKAARRRMPDG